MQRYIIRLLPEARLFLLLPGAAAYLVQRVVVCAETAFVTILEPKSSS